MKIATFNLLNNSFERHDKWSNRMESAVSLIKDQNLDLIGTQELSTRSRDYLENKLDDYYIVGGTRDSYGISDEYNSILIKKQKFKLQNQGKTYALSHTPNKKGSKLPLDLFPRIATTIHLSQNNIKYLVVNTHLDHLLGHNRKVQLKILSKIILKEKLPKEKLIVMGDFNTKTNKHIQQFMEENGLQEACLSTAKSSYRLLPMKKPIDHIFLSNDIETLDTTLIKNKYNGIYPSDHYPLKVLIKNK